jgi:hypothetical protein
MANSFAFRRSGKETTDLQVAISRIGAGMVRNVATAFALRQLRARAEFKAVEHLLAPEWTRSTRAATVTYLVAQRSRAVKPDEALVLPRRRESLISSHSTLSSRPGNTIVAVSPPPFSSSIYPSTSRSR